MTGALGLLRPLRLAADAATPEAAGPAEAPDARPDRPVGQAAGRAAGQAASRPEVRDGGLLRRGLTSVVGLAAQGIVRLAITVAVGRLAGATDLGIVAGGMATAQFLILAWPTTCGQAASRFLARARGAGDHDQLLAVAAHLRRRLLQSAALLALLSVPISLLRGLDPAGAGCVALFLWGVAGQQFTRGVHYGVDAVTRVVVLDVLLSLAGLLGLLGLLTAGVRGPALLLAPAIAYLVLGAACWPWSPEVPAGRSLRRELDRFVLFGSLGTIASAGLVPLSILAADRLGAAQAGHYAAAVNLALPLTLLSGALSLVLFPAMSQALGRGDSAAVRRHLDVGVRAVATLAVPALAAAALLAPQIVGLAYGPGFADSAGVLPILLGAILASMIAVPCVNAVTSQTSRGIVEMALASLAGLAVAVGSWWLFGARWGIAGIAGGYALGAGVTATYGIGRAWASWRPRWLGLLVGAAATVLVTAGLVVGLAGQPDGQLLARCAAAAGVAAGWALLRRRDLAALRGLARAR